jgi:hypothetical protein
MPPQSLAAGVAALEVMRTGWSAVPWASSEPLTISSERRGSLPPAVLSEPEATRTVAPASMVRVT